MSKRTWILLTGGVLMLVGVLSVLGVRPSYQHVETKPPASRPQMSAETIPLVTGEEATQDILTRAGCAVCHTIPGIPGAQGRVGPRLTLGTTGPRRLADGHYAGQAETVREYVIESVLDPSIYVVPGYPDGTMPRWYGKKLTAQALEKIAAYLEGLTATPPVARD